MRTLLMVFCLVLPPLISTAQEAGKACSNFASHGFASKAEVTKFWNEVKLKASKSDLDGLQKMMRFPLDVRNTPATATMIKDAETFKKDRSTILSKSFLKALSEMKVEDAFCNANGSGSAKGEIWAQKGKGAIQITVLNVFSVK